jgi:predicted amidohydrolase
VDLFRSSWTVPLQPACREQIGSSEPLPELDVLKPGANADIAVFELRDGTFPLRDSDGNTINAKRRLIAQLTIKDGRVWYERPSE